MTGWDLIAAAQERIGQFWTLTQSQVYRELTAMAGGAWSRAGPPGPRDRKPYEVTPAGRAAFAEWLASGPGEDQVRIPLLLTIAFAGHLPAGPAGRDHRGPPRRACRAARAVPRRPRMADGGRRGRRGAPGDAGVRLRHEQAVLDWFDVLPGILAPPLTSHCGRSSVDRIRGLGDPVLNTILITVHAVAATIAFGAGARRLDRSLPRDLPRRHRRHGRCARPGGPRRLVDHGSDGTDRLHRADRPGRRHGRPRRARPPGVLPPAPAGRPPRTWTTSASR